MIYADHAATTKLDPVALEAMLPWLQEEYANASQPYSFSRKAKKAISDARESIAKCIQALPEEIFFTSGGTESDNWVIKETALSDPAYRATITSAFEHHAVLSACEAIERLKYPVAYMWPTHDGYIDPDILSRYISDQTRLVSVMLVNNELGTIQPIQQLTDITHKQGALFHTDAVQAIGHIPVNVRELGVDFLSASAHKFNGPKGIGFLYIHKGVELMPYANGGSQEFGKRAGTENIASIVGMAKALEMNIAALGENMNYISSLEQRLLHGLTYAGVNYSLNGGKDRLPGLLNLSFDGKSGEAILHRMDLMNIMISTGSACDSVNTTISHVLKAIQLDDSLAKGTIRISLGKDNTPEEIDKIVSSLCKIVQ